MTATPTGPPTKRVASSGTELTFSFAQIAVCAAVGFVASATVLAVYGRGRGVGMPRAVTLGLVVAASILLWRSAANTGALNDDPIPWVSPNDVLAPVLTYVVVSLYGGTARLDREPDWGRLRALLVAVSFAVNVLTI